MLNIRVRFDIIIIIYSDKGIKISLNHPVSVPFFWCPVPNIDIYSVEWNTLGNYD